MPRLSTSRINEPELPKRSRAAKSGIIAGARPRVLLFPVLLALSLSVCLLLLDPIHAAARQVQKGDSAVYTNESTESENQADWLKAADEAARASTPGGPRSRAAIRRFNPELIQREKAKMQLEANSPPAPQQQASSFPEKPSTVAIPSRKASAGPAAAAPPATPVAARASAAPASPPPPPEKPPGTLSEPIKYGDLPSGIRDSLPISVTMLVYSKQPEDRSITINNLKLLQGQQSPTGFKVEEIVPDGAIMSYHGYFFLKTAARD